MEITQLISNNDSENVLLLAHGAGAGMRSPFMTLFSDALALYGIKVVRFEFPYMVKIGETGKRRPPDRAPILINTYYELLNQWQLDGINVFIGGKSMGGRMATLLLANKEGYECNLVGSIKAGVCLGYPFHPQGKPEKTRIDHLKNIRQKVLVVQGENDSFGKREEIAAYNLPKNIVVNYVEGGNHDLKSPKKYGQTHEQSIINVAEIVSRFILDFTQE